MRLENAQKLEKNTKGTQLVFALQKNLQKNLAKDITDAQTKMIEEENKRKELIKDIENKQAVLESLEEKV